MSPDPPNNADEVAQLRRRLDLLEDDNQRLREKLEPIFGTDNAAFDPRKFQRALQRLILVAMLPVYVLALAVVPLAPIARKYLPPIAIGGLPLVDAGGIKTRHPGIGVGVIGLGGAGIGIIGIGGLGVGILAIGGGAIGIVAFGGGSLGLIAFGGGAVGIIAVGGGACGRYALCQQRGAGKYVLAPNRQDDEAIEFFCRWFPFLRAAVTRPMPVIPIEKSA